MSSPVQASRSRGAIVTDIQMGLVDSRFDMHPIRGIADGPLTVKACFVLYAKPIANKAHSKSSNYQLPPKQTKGPARKRPPSAAECSKLSQDQFASEYGRSSSR